MSDKPLPRHLKGQVSEAKSDLGLKDGFSLEFPALSDLEDSIISSPIARDINSIWDINKFSQSRAPLSVGKISPEALSYRDEINISDMPIKFPGSEYRIPIELQHLKDILLGCAVFEEKINPKLNNYYAYLTYQYSPIKQGEAQRGEGAHSDSVQGSNIQPKTSIEHGYLCFDCDPTIFYNQSFDMEGVSVETHWLNAIFETQKDPNKIVSFSPGEIILSDAYCVHEASPSQSAGMRGFLRLIYSVRKFDRQGNTHNHLFDYDWPMEPKPLPKNLIGFSYER
jgi:hypothetical protein